MSSRSLRVQCFAMSIDGFSAGPNQDLQNPLGVRGLEFMDWVFHTRNWNRMHGGDGGESGVDSEFAAASFKGIGANILGRNMFGPVRGPWLDDSWKGWWGDEPPYHTPVFVLTHHARPSLEMAGGTTFQWTKCTSPSVQSCSAQASRCFASWTSGSSATTALESSPASVRLTA